MKFHSNRKSYEKRRYQPQAEKTRNPKVLIASLAAIVISLVVLCIVVVIGVVGFSSDNKESSVAAKTDKASFHVWFIAGSNVVNAENTTHDMDGVYVVKDGISYLPIDGIASALAGTVKVNDDTGVIKLRDIGKWVNLKVDSDTMRIFLLFKKTLAAKVYKEDGVIYVPAASFFKALGYDYEYTAASGRLDVFPKSDAKEEAPLASFTTDKDTYQVGEKITYTKENSSPEGYEIVDEKWENMDDWYFTAGQVNVGYSVKDYRGNWSKVYTKTLNIEGEYHAAEKIPVLSYFFLAEKDSDVYKLVTTESKTVTTTDPKGKQLSNETSKKTVDNSLYTDKSKTTTTKDSGGNTVKTTLKYTQEKVEGKYYDNPSVIRLSQFKKEMAYLHDNGYTTLTVSQYLDYQNSGVMPPAKSVLILFLNGYETTYSLAYPVLQEYGLKANIAPEVKVVEDRTPLVAAVAKGEEGAKDKLNAFDAACSFPSLTFDEIKEMTVSGLVEVGAISYNGNRYAGDHPLLAAPIYLDDQSRDETGEEYAARVKDDVNAAMTVLCDNLGENIKPFYVYPFGETSDVLTATVRDAGFSCAFIQDDGYVYADSDLFALHRLNITQATGTWDFSQIFK